MQDVGPQNLKPPKPPSPPSVGSNLPLFVIKAHIFAVFTLRVPVWYWSLAFYPKAGFSFTAQSSFFYTPCILKEM